MSEQSQINQIYDTIIIGSGPAGMTAGIYAARREMNALILGKEPGGQIMWASEIENYPGFRSINNYELISKMQYHVTDLGVKIKNKEVKKIEKDENDNFQLTTGRETFFSRTVIIAMGLSPRRLAISGEKEFTGKGVTYCANCDAPFYKGKDVAVIGGGNSALDAAEYLSKIANKVYLVHRRQDFRGFETLIEEIENKDNIELVLNSEVKSIEGRESVEKIKIHNKKENIDSEIEVQGVFIEVGRIASTDLVEDFVERNEASQIKINDRCETATPGMYAAGDVTTVPFKQITIACGQGTIAALAAYQYLQDKSK
jgi:thioredoxin-disulfide reductase